MKNFPLTALAALLEKPKEQAHPPIVVNVDLSGVANAFARKLGETELKLKHGTTVQPS